MWIASHFWVRFAPPTLRAAVCLIVIAGWLTPANGGISFVNMFRSEAYTQTANGNSLTSTEAYLSLGLESESDGDFDTVFASHPGPTSPAILSQTSPKQFYFQTPGLPSLVDLDAAFPQGTYQFDAFGNNGPASTSFDYLQDAFPISQPFLANDSYSELQNFEPAQSIVLDFSPFDPSPAADEAFVFFTIFDQNLGAVVFDAGFLPATTADVTIPAGTLSPFHSFSYELIFSDRVHVASPGAQFDAVLGFDQRTTGIFETVPEPEGWFLAVSSLTTLAFAKLIRRRALGVG